jgi:hypothetical protein
MMIRNLENTSPLFRSKLQEMARRHGWDADAIAAVMWCETAKTFSPAIRNPTSSAVGLIQFMSSTAAELGTTTDALAAMSAEEQLGWVERYFERSDVLGQKKNLRRVDYYLGVWRPRAVGAPMDEPLVSTGHPHYEANKNLFDPTHKGYIAPRDLDNAMARAYADLPSSIASKPSFGWGWITLPLVIGVGVFILRKGRS